MNIYIRNKMLEGLVVAFPEDFKRYKGFVVDTIVKELKTSSKYIYEDRKIVIASLSRDPADIYISALIQLAKHIDIIERKETHLDKEYAEILKNLLITAISIGHIKLNDVVKMSDEKTKKMLLKYYFSFTYWKIEQNEHMKNVYVYVDESFYIKNILKTHGYFYDKQQSLWKKKLEIKSLEEEEQFIDEYKEKAIFIVIADNRFYIRPVYLIKIKTFAYQEAPLLRSLGYQYDRDKRIWTKIIVAKDVVQEMKNVEELPKQSLQLFKV